jgi:hypothetical protein
MPVFTGRVFAAVVTKMFLITLLTLPAILSSMSMPRDIFSSGIKNGH